MPSPTAVEFSVITESYNLTEGTALESLRRALWRAGSAVQESELANATTGEVLLADIDGRPEIEELLKEFPAVRKISCQGLTYDAAKNRAAEAAQGDYVVYLDGDCEPEAEWLDSLLEPLRTGHATTSCGYTSYEGGFWAAIQTVMDFGFLLPRRARSIGCYPSNNWASLRSQLIELPICESKDLRCACYFHAQTLMRQDTPIWFVPQAIVLHDLLPFWSERLRRGFDHVAACWLDPELPQARWLARGLMAAPAFYFENVAIDWNILRRSRKDLDMSRGQALLASAVIPFLRLVDLVGIVRALRTGPAPD